MLVVFSHSITMARDALPDTVPVHFGMLLDGRDPVAGDVLCQLEKPSVLSDSRQPALRLSIQFFRRDGHLLEQLDVRRGEAECSFATGRPTVTSRGGHEFDVYEGSDDWIEMSLVLRPRIRIGHLSIVYQ